LGAVTSRTNVQYLNHMKISSDKLENLLKRQKQRQRRLSHLDEATPCKFPLTFLIWIRQKFPILALSFLFVILVLFLNNIHFEVI